MSAAAQSAVAAAARPQRKPSGWQNLKPLMPYVLRYKRMIVVGLLALAAMGIVGALPQLVIGVVVDLLKGSSAPLSTLTGFSRASLHFLFAPYAPFSRHALGIYCLVLIAAMLVK